MKRLVLAAVGLSVLGAGCATVKASRLSPGYEASDKQKVKRLLVVTAPFPDGKESVAKLWSGFAHKYVNLHRNFLVKADQVAGAPVTPKSLCGEGLEGVLWLAPKNVSRHLKTVKAGVDATLVRCSDGGEVWGAHAEGSWSTEDKNLATDTQGYVEKYGKEVGPYYPSAFYLLRATLDTLPEPVLTEEETNEKIELDD